MKKSLLACLSFLVFAFPSLSQAEVRKCVTPSGETIYTDQPCNAKIGSTATEVKNDSTLRKITAMQKDRDTGKSCWVLDHRYSQCSISVDRTLMTNFRENCGIPMLLMGSTHPKSADLSGLHIPVTKVFASNDQVAPKEKILANKKLLPAQTRWVEITGGNHSQFAHYRYQLLDGDATIPREEQQAQARKEILAMLKQGD